MQGNSICLIPYLTSFVAKYSEWMQDEQLLRLTASQRLTPQEEMRNCENWATSKERFTFIIADNKEGLNPCGDVNVFMGSWLDPHQYQINIMIADPQFRGRGLARKAIRMVMDYTSAYFGRAQCIAKIKADNQGSLNLFKSEFFEVVSFSEEFGQWQLRKSCEKKTKEQVTETYKMKEIEWR